MFRTRVVQSSVSDTSYVDCDLCRLGRVRRRFDDEEFVCALAF